jgi:hypothetical protein
VAFTVETEPVLVTHGIERREVPINVPAVDPAAALEIADEQAQRPAANIDHRADILVSGMLSNLSWFLGVSIVYPSIQRFPTAHKVTHVAADRRFNEKNSHYTRNYDIATSMGLPGDS